MQTVVHRFSEVQLVVSVQSPAESVGQLPSSHVQTEQKLLLQLFPSSQSPAESVGQVPSSHEHTEQ